MPVQEGIMESGGFVLKTILNEGSPSKPRGEIVFDRQMAKNDFVVIDSSNWNTYTATKGMPVGQRITSLTGQQVVGKILTVPEFEALDYDSYIVAWDEQLETEHYRTAEVIWYGINSIVVAHLQSGSITPGNTSLVIDSIETDKRVDGKLALRPGEDGDLISFHAGSAGDDVRIGIMGRVNIQMFV